MAQSWIWRRSKSIRGLRRHGPVVALFLVLSIALTWPVACTAVSALENEGDAVLNAWILGWDVGHLLQPRQLPHAPNFYPYPYTLYFSEHLLGAALLATPVIALTGNPILAYNLLFVSAFMLSALAAYTLVFWLTEDQEAAVLTGLMFASMTLRFGPSPQLQVLLNFGMPLALGFLLRTLRMGRLRDALGWAVAFAGQFLISLYHGLFLTVGMIAVGVEQIVRNPSARRGGPWKSLILAGAIAAALMLPVLEPYLEAQRWVGIRGLDQQAHFGLLSFVLVPHGHLYAALPPFREVHRYEHVETLFPGFLTLALAAWGIWRSRSPWRRPFALLVLLGAVGAIGPALRLRLEDPPLVPAMPYLLLWRFFPGFQAIRVPPRMFVLGQLGLAVLAGLGWHAWRPPLPRRRLAFALALTLAILEAYRGPFPRYPAPRPLPELDRSLAHMAGTMAFIEFPTLRTLDVLSDPETMRRLTFTQFATLFRKQPTPIGYSGFFPPLFWEVADRLLVFPSRESLAFFEDLGVNALIVRNEGWTPGEREAFEARWALFRKRFRKVLETPNGTLYELKPQPRSGSGTIGARGVRVGDRIWLFLILPREAWPWRLSISPGHYALWITAIGADEVPLAVESRRGILPLALPGYLEALPVGWIRQPSGASSLRVEGEVEPGDIGRLALPPPRPLRFQTTIALEELEPDLPGIFRIPMVEFENGITLGAIALSGYAFCPGEALEFSMFWSVEDAQALRSLSGRAPVVFVHLHDQAGRMAVGRDLPVDFGNRPLREWQPGEVVVQSYRLALPSDLPPGSASLVIGLYPLGQPDPAARWPVRSARVPFWEHAAVVGANVEILPTPCRIPEGEPDGP